MTFFPPHARAESDWLTQRAPHDTAAREHAAPLIAALNRWLAHRDDLPGTTPVEEARATHNAPLAIWDVGAGSGANMRWLAPRLDAAQDWTLVDLDAELLDAAQRSARPDRVEILRTLTAPVESLPDLHAPHAAVGRDGNAARTEFATGSERDRTGLRRTLITCSALLDVLAPAQLDALIDAAAAVGAPVLASLTVTGDVALDPPDTADGAIATAFNRHQRRDGRLGPDAVEAASAALRRRGYAVQTAATPWRVSAADPESRAFLDRYLTERMQAACEQDAGLEPTGPDLAGPHRTGSGRTGLDRTGPDWLRRRRDAIDAGRLRLITGHVDVLGIPQAETARAKTSPAGLPHADTAQTGMPQTDGPQIGGEP